MKKYYKLLTQEGYVFSWKKGTVYPEDYIAREFAVHRFAQNYPLDWQEVPEIDYLLQVAKEKYPIGSDIVSAWGTKSKVKGYYQEEDGSITDCFTNEKDGNYIYEAEDKLWAKIVDKKKTITDYENDTMMDKPMTHQEAIKELRSLLFIGSRGIYSKQALKLSIKNMEQCEVYDKFTEMEVSQNGTNWKQANMQGKFNGFHLQADGYSWQFARPIKPKVLKPNEWADKRPFAGMTTFETLYKEYNQYLNDNK